MRAWRQKWMRAMISAGCYSGLACTAVIVPWMTQIGEQKFNALVADPASQPWELAGLAVGLIGAVLGAIKSLMNRDWPEDKL